MLHFKLTSLSVIKWIKRIWMLWMCSSVAWLKIKRRNYRVDLTMFSDIRISEFSPAWANAQNKIHNTHTVADVNTAFIFFVLAQQSWTGIQTYLESCRGMDLEFSTELQHQFKWRALPFRICEENTLKHRRWRHETSTVFPLFRVCFTFLFVEI